MKLRKDFGVRIKELRQKKKLTQADLSEKVGIDAKHMSHIETGRSFPKADLIEKFAAELDVGITEMFTFTHIKPKDKLINEILKLLKEASEKDVQRLYKIIVAYLK